LILSKIWGFKSVRGEALEVLKQTVLDDLDPAEVAAVFGELAKHVGDGHLMSLLVEFGQRDWTQLVIPARISAA